MLAPGQGQRSIRFGLYELDLEARELRKNGIRLKLQDQPLRLLEMLLMHPGEVVSREDLRHQLWPLDTFVGFEQGLNTAVKKLRAALGDSATNPRFIETVARRGYRFIAPVIRTPDPPVLVGRKQISWWVAAVALAVAAVLAWLLWRQ